MPTLVYRAINASSVGSPVELHDTGDTHPSMSHLRGVSPYIPLRSALGVRSILIPNQKSPLSSPRSHEMRQPDRGEN